MSEQVIFGDNLFGYTTLVREGDGVVALVGTGEPSLHTGMRVTLLGDSRGYIPSGFRHGVETQIKNFAEPFKHGRSDDIIQVTDGKHDGWVKPSNIDRAAIRALDEAANKSQTTVLAEEPHGVTESTISDRQLELPVSDANVSAAFSDIWETAEIIGALSSDDYRWSFSSILLALLYTPQHISRWFLSYATSANIQLAEIERTRGFDPEQLPRMRAEFARGGSFLKKAAFTSSARAIFQNALELAPYSGRGGTGQLSARHLLGSYIYRLPGGHADQLREWGFVPSDWSNNFLRYLSETGVRESIWSQLHTKTFEANVAKQPTKNSSSTLSPDAVTQQEQADISRPFMLSSSGKAIVSMALRLANQSQRTAITSSCLLFAFAEQAGEAHDTARFAKDALNRTGQYSVMFEKFLRNPEVALEHEALSGLEGVFSENARRILEHALVISETVSHGGRLIHARHLFGGLLAAPVVIFPGARKTLVDLGFDLVALSADFLKFIAVYARNDDQEKWRFILGSPSSSEFSSSVGGQPPPRALIDQLFATFESKLDAILAAATAHEGEQVRDKYRSTRSSYEFTKGKFFRESPEIPKLCDEAQALIFQLNEIEKSLGDMRVVILVINAIAGVLAQFAVLVIDQPPEVQAIGGLSSEFAAGTAGYTSEYCGVGPGGFVPDHLGVQGQAQRLAELIALKETKLPLAIGLFGNWGSGKSHFMNLIDRHMESLSRRDEDEWCKQIVPVYFNAWHYSDSNLWASLVTEIFDALFKRLEPKADQLAILQERLKEAGGVTTLAVEEVESAKQVVLRAAATLAAAQVASENAKKQLSFVEGLKTILPELDTEKNRARVEELLGISVDSAGFEDLQEKHKELKSLAGRVRELWRRLARPEGRAGRILWFLGATIATLLLRLAAKNFPWIEGRLRNVAPTVQLLLGGCLTFAAWLTPYIAQFRNGLGQLEDWQKKAETAQEKLPAKERVHNAKNDLEQAESRARLAEIAMEAAKAQEGQLRNQTEQLRPERRLSNFIDARARSADYRGQLGLVSLARRDFEELTRIFTDTEASVRGSDDLQTGRGDVEAALSASVDRVVLYIDDLDRCEPEKVVDVLQAVHLLLAYRLFAVVVGVDQRCLKQSLRIRFKGLLTPSRSDRSSKHSGLLDAEDIPATPLDYLEKIFHIPFHLPVMGKEGFSTLVERLTEPAQNSVSQSTERPDNATDTGQPSEAGSVSEAPLKRDLRSEEALGKTKSIASLDVDSGPSTNKVIESPSLEAGSVRSGTNVDGGDTASRSWEGNAVRRVGSVPLHRWERDALKEYYGLIRTPRGATRLLNTYRLVRAGLPAEEWDHFRSDEGGGGQAHLAMLLLAVAAGQPACARSWFSTMRLVDSKEWALPQRTHDSHEFEWEEFRRLCSKASKQMNSTLDRGLVGLWLDRVERFSF